MVLAVLDQQNDCSFGVRFNDESRLDEVKKLSIAGLGAWFKAAHTEIEADEYFTKEEIEGFYNSGYAEPASELLDRCGIDHEIVTLIIDDEDNVVCDEYVLY